MHRTALTGGAILEREHELGRIDALLEAARGGAGTAVVVEGVAGIGKTRLLAEAGARARDLGSRVLSARGGELEREFSFGVVRQLFEPVLQRATTDQRAQWLAGAAALAAPIAAGIAPERGAGPVDPTYGILHGLYWLTANVAHEAPLVLLVDDAQWADESSLRFLLHLLPRIDALPVALAVAMWPWNPEADSKALGALAADRSVERLELMPLSLIAVLEQVREGLGEDVAPAFAAACHAATDGNPFYLHELLSEALAQALPPTAEAASRVATLDPTAISRSVLARLAPLPDSSVKFARAVAILGDGAPMRRAAALAGLDGTSAGEAADALANAGILAADDTLSFRHPILRSAVEATLSPRERARAHVQAAALLADEGAPAERIAVHLLATQPDGNPTVVRTLLQAAESAVANGAPEAAAAYLERALAEPPPMEVMGAVLLELGRVELMAGRSSSIEHLCEALDAVTEPEQVAAAARALASALAVTQCVPEAVEVLLTAIERLGEADHDLALGLQAELAIGSSDPRTAPAVAGRLQSIAKGLRGQTPNERLALAAASLMRSPGNRGETADEAAERVQRTLSEGRLGVEHPDSFIAMEASYNAAQTLLMADRLEAVESLASGLLARARARGSVRDFITTMTLSSVIAYQRGSIARAEGDARVAVDALRELAVAGAATSRSVAALVDALVERSELDEADRLLREHGLDGHLLEHLFHNNLLLSRARLRLAQRRTAEGIADLLALEERLRPGGFLRLEFGWRAELALAYARQGDTAEAQRRAADLDRMAARWGTPRAIGAASRTQGLLADGEEALRLLQSSASLLGPSPARLELARSLCELGAALRRRGLRTQAREPLGRALELAYACRAVALEKRVREELRAAGARPRRVHREGVDALTASELRIAELAASGLSNREIAQALFVTAKTVEMHLSNGYRKLGIHGRSELASRLTREGGYTMGRRGDAPSSRR